MNLKNIKVLNNIFKKQQVILVIPDLHIPYHHKDAVKFLTAVATRYAPTEIVILGDEVDSHAISFHDHDPDLASSGDELKKAKSILKAFYAIFPKATVLDSNHGSLIYRRAVSAGLSRDYFKAYREILDAPSSWVWKMDYIINTPLGKVYFHHSKGSNVLRNSQCMGMSFVQGHHHEQMEIRYWANPERLMFGATVGSLVDRQSLAFAYAKSNLKKQLIGCMLINEGIPQLVPLLMNNNGHWIGKL